MRWLIWNKCCFTDQIWLNNVLCGLLPHAIVNFVIHSCLNFMFDIFKAVFLKHLPHIRVFFPNTNIRFKSCWPKCDLFTVVENVCVCACVCPQAIGEISKPGSHFEEMRSSFVVLDSGCVYYVSARLNDPNLKPCGKAAVLLKFIVRAFFLFILFSFS